MGIAYFGTDQIGTNSYAVLSGSSQPEIIIYPRTIGGLIQESGIVEKTLKLKSYTIGPINTTRQDIENFIHNLNEQIGDREDVLSVNGNVYLAMSVNNINYDFIPIKKWITYDIDFKIGSQNIDNDMRQLECPNLQNFSRGRKMKFVTDFADGTSKTFWFWHNFDLIKNLEIQLAVKRSDDYNTGRVIRTGGFEKIICHGWIIGPEDHNRRNLEAYFYNIINGPLGRLGTLHIDPSQIITNAFLTNVNMEETTNQTIKYELTFISSLQC